MCDESRESRTGRRSKVNLFGSEETKTNNELTDIINAQANPLICMSNALKRFWKTVPLYRLQQGSTLTIRSRIPSLHVKIEPQWRDNGMAGLEQILPSDESRRNRVVEWNVQQNTLEVETSLGRQVPHIIMDLFDTEASTAPEEQGAAPPESDGAQTATEANLPEGAYLTIQTPESVNLDVDVTAGSIHIQNKVEGDVKLATGNGDIAVKKIRGHVVHLETKGPTSLIHAKSTLEARDLYISTSGRFRAKQCHGSNIEVVAHCKDPAQDGLYNPRSSINDEDDEGSMIDIGSLFVSGDGSARIRSESEQRLRRRAVRIKSHHGAVHVETNSNGQPPIEQHPHTKMAYPVVELGGVNGCCEVFCRSEEGRVPSRLNDDKETNDWNSCLMHVDSLLPDRINVLASDHGSIGVTLDRKVEAELRLASVPHSVAEVSATVADEEDTQLLVKVLKNLVPMNENTAPKDADSIATDTHAFTEGESSFTSPNVVYRGGTVRNKSAEPDSRFDRRGAGKVNADAAAAQAFAGFSSEDGNGDVQHPLLAVVGKQKIILETVSWIGAIARRYGLDESEDRQLGRTASRRGREFIGR